MAGAYKRGSDKARGKQGKWTGWYHDRHGRRKTFAGTTDKAVTIRIAQQRESEEKLVAEGIVDPATAARRAASGRLVYEHIADYRAALVAKGDTERHARHVASVIRGLLADAAVGSVADLAPDRIAEALGRLAARRSARTVNHALGAVKAFARWLEHHDRIAEVPRVLRALRPRNQQVDRRRVRRALSGDELARLLAATEQAPPVVARRERRGGRAVAELSGPDRAMLYRLAIGTGFRANELRTLTPECFELDGREPCVVVRAAYSKRRRDDRQPIARMLAEELRPWLRGRPAGLPVLAVPEKAAKMLAADLALAGIPAVDERGRTLDFHALWASYITDLIRRGANPKVVQRLARHSTITLTMDTYAQAEDDELRRALESDRR